jgi:hypothetical protein
MLALKLKISSGQWEANALLPWQIVSKIIFFKDTAITQSSRVGQELTARKIKFRKPEEEIFKTRSTYPCLFQSIT